MRPVRPIVRCMHYPGYMYKKASLCQIFTARCSRQTTAAIGLCVWGQPLFPGMYERLSFSVLRQGVQAAHPVLHQRRHWMSAGGFCDTISIFESCDALTAATVLNLSVLNMFGYNGLSRANSLIDMSLVNRYSVLQKCVCVRVQACRMHLSILSYHMCRF